MRCRHPEAATYYQSQGYRGSIEHYPVWQCNVDGTRFRNLDVQMASIGVVIC